MNNVYTYETRAQYFNGDDELKFHSTFDAACTYAIEECEWEGTIKVVVVEYRNGKENRNEPFTYTGAYA